MVYKNYGFKIDALNILKIYNLYFGLGLYLSPQHPLLKKINSLLKYPIYYNILNRVPKKQCKGGVSAARSQRAFNIKPHSSTVPLKASVRSGRLAPLRELNYHLLRAVWKRQGVLIRVNITVSCEQAAL